MCEVKLVLILCDGVSHTKDICYATEKSVAIFKKVKHWKYIWSVLKNSVLVSHICSVNNKLLVILVL